VSCPRFAVRSLPPARPAFRQRGRSPKVLAVLSLLVGVALVGCAPARKPGAEGGGNAVETVEVIETETVKPAPVAEPRQEMDASKAAADASKAAADKAIDDAAKSIEPKPEPKAEPKPEPKPEPKAEPKADAKPEMKPEPEPKPEPKADTKPEPKAESKPEPKPEPKPKEAAGAAGPMPLGPVQKVKLGDPSLTAGVPGQGPITVEQVEAWLTNPENFRQIEPILPLGLSQGQGQVTGLEENPLTRAKIELGRQLYFDPRLSADNTISCASCHDPSMSYTAHTRTGVGIKGQEGGRNSPVSFNRILSGPQFWDGRADSLEAQAVGPIANPIEMGFTHEGVVKRLGEMPVYKKQFEAIFGELTIDRVGQAIAAFERVLVTAPSPYDYGEQLRPFAAMDPEDIADDEDLAAKYAAAKKAAEAHPMSESAQRGRDLFFGKANCTACHVGANLADEKYHNLGIGMDKDKPDVGRFAVTKDPKDTGAFKTPTVRNVALTAPYMHDGSVATLEEVVEWYDKGGHPNPNLSDKMKPLNLTAQEKADLVEFMKACTGPTPSVETSRLPADA
jgi:cytochrome c peroxidase